MRSLLLASPLLMLTLSLGAEEGTELKSGLQPGEKAGAFNVLDCTGPSKGKKLCYR